MPTYEYECQKCKVKFEKFQNMKDAPVEKCPDCGGKVDRLIGGGSGILFKGSGFYQTDYKNKTTPKPGSCGKDKPGGCGSCPHSKD